MNVANIISTGTNIYNLWFWQPSTNSFLAFVYVYTAFMWQESVLKYDWEFDITSF